MCPCRLIRFVVFLNRVIRCNFGRVRIRLDM